jgi:hypothetical protein
MNAREKIAEPVLGRSQLEWPRYTPGLLLQDEDLTRAVDYTRDLSRLLFRSFFGCGVVCGLKVDAAEKCGKIHITVAPGIALDGRGDPVQIKSATSLTIDPSCGKRPPDSMCLVVRRHENPCAPRPTACAADDDESSATTRVVDGFELRVLAQCPECGCGCPPCEPPAEVLAPPAPEQPTQPEINLIESAAGYKPAPEAVSAKTSADTISTSANAMVKRETRDCRCADPTDPCYAGHYAGKCACCCDSEWVSLARVYLGPKDNEKNPVWQVDHSVRRFIRPVLMQDPLVDCTRRAGNGCCSEG